MAGSDKLYLEPVLKELLDGLDASMQSIDGIVDGLGDAVDDMKTAVENVNTVVGNVENTLTSVQGTLTTTNGKLDTLNSTVNATKEYILGDSSLLENVVNPYQAFKSFATGRFEEGETIVTFVSYLDGALLCQLGCSYSGTSESMNCGIKYIDLMTGEYYFIIDHAPLTATLKTFYIPVKKFHAYAFECAYPGGPATDPNDVNVSQFDYKPMVGQYKVNNNYGPIQKGIKYE